MPCRAQRQLWQGSTVEAIAEFVGITSSGSKSFRNICENISQESQITRIIFIQGIDIGSGAVESLIKQIGARIKVVGAQWNEKKMCLKF